MGWLRREAGKSLLATLGHGSQLINILNYYWRKTGLVIFSAHNMQIDADSARSNHGLRTHQQHPPCTDFPIPTQ